VLLEVSQLLTALFSPLSPVEENDRMAALKVPGKPEPARGHDVDLEVRKSVTDLECVHSSLRGGDE